MRDAELVGFLRQVLPRLGLRWEGYRKVRGQVGKRIKRRMRALGLADLTAYAERLAAHPEERAVLEALCLIPISRFYRDREVWDRLRETVLPALADAARARGATTLACWSAGCASGEEPYTLALCWHLDLAARFPDIALSVLATDADHHLLERARTGCYAFASLKELPRAWLERAFDARDVVLCLKPEMRAGIAFAQEDMRRATPPGPFDLILCRNAAFTYFDDAAQRAFATTLTRMLRPGGALVLGRREALPAAADGLRQPDAAVPIYRVGGRAAASDAATGSG